MTDAIYFVEPTRESIDRIIEDFPAVDQFDYDQYGQVHLVFTKTCPDSLVEELAMNEKLSQKMMTFTEANVDFQVYMDNVFLLNISAKKEGIAGYKAANASGTRPASLPTVEEGEDLIKTIGFRVSLTRQVKTKIVSQLMTLCSCLYEKPRIFTHR